MIGVLDIGGTTTRIGLSRIGVTLERHYEFPTPPGKPGLADIAAQLAVRAAGPLNGLVVGLAGSLDEHGRLVRSPNLPVWQGQKVAERFNKLVRGPVLLTNDVVLGGLGEAIVGAGSAKGIMAYFTVSTGVNGVRIVNGRPDGPAELGQQLLGWPKPQTLESLIGGRAMQERYGRLPSQIDDPALWAAEAATLAVALHNLCMHWQPRLIVLGGSLMRDIPLEEVESELAKLPNPFGYRPQLRPAALGQLGGLHGGLAYWRQHSS